MQHRFDPRQGMKSMQAARRTAQPAQNQAKQTNQKPKEQKEANKTSKWFQCLPTSFISHKRGPLIKFQNDSSYVL